MSPDRNSNRSQIEGSPRRVSLFQRHCPTHRIITHYYYPAWPDRGVPQDPSSLCFFAEHIRKDLEAGPRLGPAVVHCRSDSQRPELGKNRHGWLSKIDSACSLAVLFKNVALFCALSVQASAALERLRPCCGSCSCAWGASGLTSAPLWRICGFIACGWFRIWWVCLPLLGDKR